MTNWASSISDKSNVASLGLGLVGPEIEWDMSNKSPLIKPSAPWLTGVNADSYDA
jgi:hypothetical protein